MMRSRKWMWVTLFLTLILGMSLGILLDRNLTGQRHQDDRKTSFKDMLESELGLSPEQKEELEKVLTANRARADDFWTQTRSSYAELRQEFRQLIRALLTPEQQERFDDMMAEIDARRAARRKRDK
jgi:Spy/CpxP family protein refolding chaperone